MEDTEEFEKAVFKINIFVAFAIGLGICVFGDVGATYYFIFGGVLLFFSILEGLVFGVIPFNVFVAILLNFFNFGWFYYWSYAEDELLISLIFPTGLMIALFIFGTIVFQKEIMEKHEQDKKR